jgi:hypothetical protein
MATWSPMVVERNVTGGRALLRLPCSRHCVGRFSDHTLASDAYLHTRGAGTRGLIIVPYTPRHRRGPQPHRSGLSTIAPPVLNDSNWPLFASRPMSDIQCSGRERRLSTVKQSLPV